MNTPLTSGHFYSAGLFLLAGAFVFLYPCDHVGEGLLCAHGSVAELFLGLIAAEVAVGGQLADGVTGEERSLLRGIVIDLHERSERLCKAERKLEAGSLCAADICEHMYKLVNGDDLVGEDIAFAGSALFGGADHALGNVAHVNEVVCAECERYGELAVKEHSDHLADGRDLEVIGAAARAGIADNCLKLVVVIVRLFESLTFARLVQPEKADSPISVTLSGITISARLVQSEKADLPIDVTLSGITISARLAQLEKADSPISDTLSGITISVRLSQPEKVSASIIVRLSGIVISARLVQPEKADSPISVTLSGITISLRLVQSLKVPSSIIIKLFESFTFERLVQPEKAHQPIDVTLSGITISARLVQPEKAPT